MIVFRLLAVLTALFWTLAAATAASAATIDLTLRFDGNSYLDFRILDTASGATIYETDELSDQDDIAFLGLPLLIDLPVGGQIGLKAQTTPDGTGLISCDFGGSDCATGAESVGLSDSGFDFRYASDTLGLSGDRFTGGSVVYQWLPSVLSWVPLGQDLRAEWSLWKANFTVLDDHVPPMTPVPLPASAPLMLAGFAGLAALRRRRRA